MWVGVVERERERRRGGLIDGGEKGRGREREGYVHSLFISFLSD